MTEKSDFRTAAYAIRKQAFGQGLDVAANACLLAEIAKHPASIVSAYMPIRTEISPLIVMKALVEQGKRVVVPVIVGKAQPLEFHEWTPDCEMQNGPFGAKIPLNGAVLVPDVVITPLLAFDLRGYRLGYGGGFYDRSFELMRANALTIGIGFAYGIQQVDVVPTEPTDQRLDAIVTEAGSLALTP